MESQIFTCVRCGLISPVLKERPCSYIYCRRCIAKAEANGQFICSLSHEHENHVIDGNSEDELCYYCSNELDLSDIKGHYDNCDMFPIKCVFCDKNFIRKMIKLHVRECAHHSTTFSSSQTFEPNLQNSPEQTSPATGKIDLPSICDSNDSNNNISLDTFVHLFKQMEEKLDAFRAKQEEFENNCKEKIEKLTKKQRNDILECQARLTSKKHSLFSSCYSFQYIWKVKIFSKLQHLAKTGVGSVAFSNPFYSGEFGYKMRLLLYPYGRGAGKGSHLSVYVQIMKGPNDAILKWPIEYTAQISVLDQSKHKDDLYQMFRSCSSKKVVEKPVTDVNISWGLEKFIPIKDLLPPYLVDDTVYIKSSITVYT